MRVINSEKNVENSEVSTNSHLHSPNHQDFLTHKSYHEMADVPLVEQDALAQLHNNIQMLQDLQGRLSFVMKEVRYLMKV